MSAEDWSDGITLYLWCSTGFYRSSRFGHLLRRQTLSPAMFKVAGHHTVSLTQNSQIIWGKNIKPHVCFLFFYLTALWLWKWCVIGAVFGNTRIYGSWVTVPGHSWIWSHGNDPRHEVVSYSWSQLRQLLGRNPRAENMDLNNAEWNWIFYSLPSIFI